MQTKTVQGFTLVEMVLYVALCSIILLSLSTFLSFLLGARVKSQSIAEVNQQGSQVVHLITQTVRNGTVIQSPTSGASSSSLSVVVTNGALSPTIFDISSGTLRIREGAGAYIPITNSRVTASSLLFQNISSSSSASSLVRFSFELSHVNREGRSEYSFSKIFSGSATIRK